MSPDPRMPCPVLTCDRSMSSGQIMCPHCWSKVPASLRRSVERSSGGAKAEHIRTALHAAQSVSR
ncbi:MAG: hypothetical protein NTV97_33925 [Alphaproteobacteria bacterium]|nr:hypothetical protein [Alphaproteobacteria bacterium]